MTLLGAFFCLLRRHDWEASLYFPLAWRCRRCGRFKGAGRVVSWGDR